MNKDYLRYLKKRSFLALMYRRLYLYPKLKKFCSKNFLDVGCGIGDFIKFMGCGIGIDINNQTIEYCKKQGLNVRLMKNNIIPFDNNTFETVILDNVIEHIEEPKDLFREIYRVMSFRANIIIGVPGTKGYMHDNDHKVFYNHNKLQNLLNSFNFEEINFFYTPLNHMFLDNKIRQFCLYSIFKIIKK